MAASEHLAAPDNRSDPPTGLSMPRQGGVSGFVSAPPSLSTGTRVEVSGQTPPSRARCPSTFVFLRKARDLCVESRSAGLYPLHLRKGRICRAGFPPIGLRPASRAPKRGPKRAQRESTHGGHDHGGAERVPYPLLTPWRCDVLAVRQVRSRCVTTGLAAGGMARLRPKTRPPVRAGVARRRAAATGPWRPRSVRSSPAS